MASGIFSTTRVAGEGIALALVVALLAGLLQHALADQALPAETLMGAARQLAGGDLPGTLAALPALGREGLLALYGQAFSQLLQVLTLMTLLAALVVWVTLREPRQPGPSAA